jgi:hypothetical protein
VPPARHLELRSRLLQLLRARAQRIVAVQQL